MVQGPSRSWEQSLVLPLTSWWSVACLPEASAAQEGVVSGRWGPAFTSGSLCPLGLVTPGADDKSGETLLFSPQSSLLLHHHILCIGSIFWTFALCVVKKEREREIFEVG